MNKKQNESDVLSREDWRLYKADELATPFKSPRTDKLFPVGSTIVHHSSMRINGVKFSFGVPSAPALFLDLSKKSFDEATKLKKRNDFLNIKTGTRSILETSLLFDFLEQIMSSVVFAYTAVESFVNTAIPDNYICRRTKNGGKCIEEYNKSQIEMFFSLSDKLELLTETITPQEICNMKGTILWQRFQNLERLRNRIIHLKSIDLETEKPDNPVPDSIWQELVKIPATYRVASDILIFFSGGKTPRWLRKFDELSLMLNV